jgi:phage tail sheath protein FI
MVQVSYPGVYVQEVPSGARTITGVSTAIAAFVGVTRRGPLLKPTTVLGFTEYTRIFGSDVSKGELTDQVRQFFLNGGQQAVIVRIGKDTKEAFVEVTNGGAGPQLLTIKLTARSAGSDGNSLRAKVDYNTGTPERSFNLTIFEELVDPSGNPTIGASESFSNLSLEASDARYIKRVVEANSALIGLVEFTPSAIQAPTGAFSASGRLATDFAALAGPIVFGVPGTTGKFRLRIGDFPTVTVSVAKPATSTDPLPIASVVAAVQAAVNLLGSFTVGNAVGDDVLVTYENFTGPPVRQFLKIATGGDLAGQEVRLERADTDDIAVALGLGEAQGGIEVGGHASHRPLPNALVSPAGGNLGDLIAAGARSKGDYATTFGVTSSPGAFSVTGFVFPSGNTGTLDTEGGVISFANLKQNLQAIATAINNTTDDWLAEVHGFRLSLLPTFGGSGVGPGVTLSAGAFASLIPAANRRVAGTTFGAGSNGTNPGPTEYQAAYTALDSQVDLFNILVLPKNGEDLRESLWGAASAFCVKRRAFLLIDAEADVDSVDEALAAVQALRIGLAKDYSALYWPRLKVNPDGSPRTIDASGTIAGVMSRIDSNRGVWKAPAGLEADLRGVLGVSVPMSDPENGRLNPQALNALRVFPNGIVSWGARTMDGFDNSGNDDYKYVPVRRFTLFLEESLLRGLKFAVFEPNDEPLWAQIRLAAGAFMNNLFRRGAFAGRTTREAYFVKVDSETTTQNDINLGIVNVVVGFAPLKPAEFIVITIQQKAGQVQV